MAGGHMLVESGRFGCGCCSTGCSACGGMTGCGAIAGCIGAQLAAAAVVGITTGGIDGWGGATTTPAGVLMAGCGAPTFAMPPSIGIGMGICVDMEKVGSIVA